jgi:hypothetical protein
VVEYVLGGWVFLDCLDVGRDGDAQSLQLDGNRSQGFDHLGLVLGQSSRVLEVHQSFLDDLVDLVLSNEAEIFSSGDGENLSVPLRVLVLAEADKGSSFGVDSLDGLSSFADDQSDQSDRDFHFDFVRTVYCPAVHLSLGFNNEVELLPDSLDRFRVTLNENISGFGIGST